MTDETLSIAVAASTGKACAPSLIHQDDVFLEVLKAARHFSFSPVDVTMGTLFGEEAWLAIDTALNNMLRHSA